MKRVSSIQVQTITDTGAYGSQVFDSVSTVNNQNIAKNPLEDFLRYLIAEGIVDEIKYTKEFSLLKSTTQALEGKA